MVDHSRVPALGLVVALLILSSGIGCRRDATPWHWNVDAPTRSLPLELDLLDPAEAARWEPGGAIRSLERTAERFAVVFDPSARAGRYVQRHLPLGPDTLGTVEIVTRAPTDPLEIQVFIRGELDEGIPIRVRPRADDPRRQLARFRVGRWQHRPIEGIRIGVPGTTDTLEIERIRIDAERYPPLPAPASDVDWRAAFRASGRPMNLLLLVVDTLRADRLSLLGYERPTSPSLDELARFGTVFESARAQATCTFPSVNSLLASRPIDDFLGEPSRERRSLRGRRAIAERLRGAGFRTAAISSSRIVRATPSLHNDWGGGYDAGFERFDETCAGQRADCMNAAADAMLDALSNRDRPFFLYLHYLDPHDPYRPPAHFVRAASRRATGVADAPLHVRMGDPTPYTRMLYEGSGVPAIPRDLIESLSGLYDEEIGYLDSELARLFESLRRRDLLRSTLVVLTSDHGESFLEHDHLQHCRSVFEVEAHVPLVFWIPGLAGGTRVADPVALLDVVPTLLDFLGLLEAPAPEGESMIGRSLRPLLEGGALPSRPTFTSAGAFRSVTDGRFKWIANARTDEGRLYDLALDPAEERNLVESSAHATIRDRLAGMLSRRVGELEDGAPSAALEELERQLEALGYLE